MKIVAVVPPGPQDKGALPVPEDWEVVMIRSLGDLTDEVLTGVDVMLVTHHNPLNRETLKRLTGLKLVQQIGVGVDSIDIEAARELGVPVANTSKVNDVAVAEYTIMAMIWVMRRMGEAIELERGDTIAVPVMIARGNFELRGKVLGIVGFGAIARELAARASAMGMEMLSHDITDVTDEERDLGVCRVPFDELLSSADVVSLHVPLTEQTRYLIGREEIARMKKGSYLINASRGGTVDETALVEALESGHLAGAALDVLEVEPMKAGNPLASAPNVLLTPHMAGSTTDAVNSMLRKSLENCGRIAAGQAPIDLVT